METRVLRLGSIRALLAAEVVSTTGAQMTWVALPWFVLTTSWSATRTSVVITAEAIGLALTSLLGVRLLNRVGARMTMLACDASRGPLMLVIPVLHWTGQLSFGAVVGNVVSYRLIPHAEGLGWIARVALIQAAPLWVLVADSPAVVAVGALFVSGLGNGLINPRLHAITTLRIPVRLRPSVMSSLTSLHMISMPVGILGAGPLLDAFGVAPVFAATAAIQTVVMVGVALAALRARAAGGRLPAGEPPAGA